MMIPRERSMILEVSMRLCWRGQAFPKLNRNWLCKSADKRRIRDHPQPIVESLQQCPEIDTPVDKNNCACDVYAYIRQIAGVVKIRS
jgi:hypothetical protein